MKKQLNHLHPKLQSIAKETVTPLDIFQIPPLYPITIGLGNLRTENL
jgi:hypothetical protein